MEFGCTSFSWETRDGRHLLGRTYDQFGDLKANRVLAVPAGIPCSPGLRAGREDLIGNGPGKLVQPDQAYLRRLSDKSKARAIAGARATKNRARPSQGPRRKGDRR